MTSLRRDVHSAFEAIAPPVGGMPERVVQTVLADKRRQRKERMVYRMRFPLALVAAVLLAAVAVAAILTWNSVRNNVSPAGGAHLTSLQQLEARPLRLPTAAPGAPACPNHPGSNSHGFGYGDGPVYGNGSPVIVTPWGHLYDVVYYTDPGLKGPILVRGRDLQSDLRLVFVSPAGKGPVGGIDSSQNPPTLHTEFILDPTNPPAKSGVFGMFPVRQGIGNGWHGCFGVQIDGPTFTELIYGYDSSNAATQSG